MGKKKVKPGAIEADLRSLAINVHYTEEVTDDRTGEVTKTRKVKQVKLPALDPTADIGLLAENVVSDCKYIPASRVGMVEQALLSLQSRVLTGGGNAKTTSSSSRGSSGAGGGRGDQNSMTSMPVAAMDRVDEYLELMYDDQGKAQGTAMVLQLCMEVKNLETLIQNDSLMALLSRLLESEYKASMEMCFHIVRIFLAFSDFLEMHPLLAECKAGALTMKVLAHEATRVNQSEKDLAALQDEERRIVTSSAIFDSSMSPANIAEKRRQEELDRDSALQKFKKKRLKFDAKSVQLKKQSEKIQNVCYLLLLNLADDLSVERKMLKRGLMDGLVSTLKAASCLPLITTCVTFLKKLSVVGENKNRMGSQDLKVLPLLAPLLPAVALRGKGSGGGGAASSGGGSGGGEVGEQFSADALTSTVLRLLLNLSFDKSFRESMVREGLLPRVVALLSTAPRHRALSLRLLYHLSGHDDRTKALFAYTDAIPIVSQMVIHFPGERLGRELAALAVNLSWHPRNADAITNFPKKGAGLYELMQRVEAKRDPLLMKIIRNISLWTYNVQMALSPEALKIQGAYEQRGLWGRHVDTLLNLALEQQGQRDEDLLVEVLGTLANLTVLDLPRTAKDPNPKWASRVRQRDLLGFLGKYLIPEMAQADVVLEVVMVLGSLLQDESVAPLVASSAVPRLLLELWKDKADSDEEIKLQLLFTFFRLLSHQATREELLYSTRCVSEILGCLTSDHPAIKATANLCLDIVVECDRKTPAEAAAEAAVKAGASGGERKEGGGERGAAAAAKGAGASLPGGLGPLGLMVYRRRFEAYNKEWIEATDNAHYHGIEESEAKESMGYGGGHGGYGEDSTDQSEGGGGGCLSPDGNGYDDGYGNLSSPEGFPGEACGKSGGNGSRLTLSGRDALPMSREDDDDEEEGDDEEEDGVGVGRGGVGRQFGGAARTASGREPIHLRQEEDEEGKAHSDRTLGSGARRYHSGGEDEAKGFAGSDDDDDEEEAGDWRAEAKTNGGGGGGGGGEGAKGGW